MTEREEEVFKEWRKVNSNKTMMMTMNYNSIRIQIQNIRSIIMNWLQWLLLIVYFNNFQLLHQSQLVVFLFFSIVSFYLLKHKYMQLYCRWVFNIFKINQDTMLYTLLFKSLGSVVCWKKELNTFTQQGGIKLIKTDNYNVTKNSIHHRIVKKKIHKNIKQQNCFQDW